METIRGKTSLDLDFNGLNERLADYNRIMLDLGTGDGRYVHSLAERTSGLVRHRRGLVPRKPARAFPCETAEHALRHRQRTGFASEN